MALHNTKSLILASLLLLAHTASFAQSEVVAENSDGPYLEKIKSGYHKVFSIGFSLGGAEFADESLSI